MLAKRQKAQLKPLCIGRWIVVKHSWRGAYRRLLCISPTEVFTQDPALGSRVTNSYSVGADADIDGITIGPGPDDFQLLVRGDKTSKRFSPVKFSCKQRAQLLTALYHCLAYTTAVVNPSLAYKLLGSADKFPCSKWCKRQAAWQSVTLQLASFELQCLDNTSGEVIWRVHYAHMGSPAFQLLANSSTGPPPQATPDGTAPAPAGLPVTGVFGITRRGRRRPKIFACSSRDTLLAALKSVAAKKVGCELAVDTTKSGVSVQDLEARIAQSEQQAAAELCEHPIAEWEVQRLRARHDVHAALAPLSAPHLQARPVTARDILAAAAPKEMAVAPGANLVTRRLVLTASHLVERRAGSYSLATAHPLAAVKALVRFAEDPQLLGVEWADLSPPSLFLTPARDTILAALLDAAQMATNTPIPLLPGLTSAGDCIVLAEPALKVDMPWVCDVTVDETGVRDAQRWATEELLARAKECQPVLNTSGRMFFTADIDFKSSHGGSTIDVRNPPTPSYFQSINQQLPEPTTVPQTMSQDGTGADGAVSPSGAAAAAAAAADGAVVADRPSRSGSEAGVAVSGAVSANGAAAPAAAPAGGAAVLTAITQAVTSRTGEPATVREAVEVMLEAVAEFNACVPYAGVPAAARVDAHAAAALLALLPPELQPGLVAPPHLPADDVKSAVLVLQCLQRLAASHHAAERILSAPGAIGRLFTALACGEDHVAYEAALLLLRLTSPHTTRAGAVPWRALRGGVAAIGTSGTAADSSDPSLDSSNDDLELAKTAKALCFTPSLLQTRVNQLLSSIKRDRPQPSPVLTMALVETVCSMACEPGSATTDTKLLQTLLTETAALGRSLFSLFHHPALRVADGVAVIMRAVAESGTAAAAPMREASLREGAMLHHLLLATSSTLGPRTTLSRDLVASWADEYGPGLALLRRVFPPGLIRHLNIPKSRTHLALPAAAQPQASAAPAAPTLPPVATQPTSPQAATQVDTGATGAAAAAAAGSAPADASQPGSATAVAAAAAAPPAANTAAGTAGAATAAAVAPVQGEAAAPQPAQPASQPPPQSQPTQPAAPAQQPMHVLVSGGLRGNWDAFWEALGWDHCHAGLVWNEACRRELRDALLSEENDLRARRRQVSFQAGAAVPTWNHEEFRVQYQSLSKHVCIGGIYIRLLLDGADTAAVGKLPAPRDLFQSLHHHLICSDSHLTHAHTSSLHATNRQPTASTAASLAAAAALESSALSEVESMQLLCVRAMTEVYHAHAGVVGPMEGLPHLMRLMDLSLRRPLRHHLLLLMAAALQPRCAQTSPQALKVARANAASFGDEGGVELLVNFAAAAHEASDDALAAVVGPATGANAATVGAAPGHLITASGHDSSAQEWFYYPNGVVKSNAAGAKSGSDGQNGPVTDSPTQPDIPTAASGNGSLSAPDATGRVGPVSKGEILTLWKSGQIQGHTLFWAEGLPAPAPLAGVRELRWLVSGGAPVMGSREVARVSLQLLLALAALQPATDAAGSVLQPLPRVLRTLASPKCLPHVVQLLLTRDPQLVSQTATLLKAALAHNEDVLARLYRTGLFYFTLSYAGNNFNELASLFHASHLKQAHRGASSATPAGAPLATRSYLGHILPESLLYCLDTYGAQAFSHALCGDSDTPELRWTHSMRWGVLIPQLTAHLGDLPQRLAQNWSGTVWSYTPAPPISYPDLKEELWCHRYYLRSLCNEVSYPDWPILDHIQFMQALLAEWRAELSRQPLALSESEACAVLGIKVTQGGVVSEDDMRKAYRSMARKYHPDKNPAGRPMFIKIQQAYDRLQAGAAGGQGPQPWRITLILKAQAILLRRFKALMAPYKYAGYPMLLEVLKSLNSPVAMSAATTMNPADTTAAAGVGDGTSAPGGTHFMSPDQIELTQAACELCWRTVCTSHLNADELARCDGVTIVAGLFQRLCGTRLLGSATSGGGDPHPATHEAILATRTLRSIAGFAASDVAREQIAAVPGLIHDIIRCCSLSKAHAAAEAALVALGHLCVSPQMQTRLLQQNALAHVVPLLFMYDSTVQDEEGQSIHLPFTYNPLTGAGPPAAAPPGINAQAATAQSFHALELPELRSSEGRARNYRAMLAAQVLSRLAGVCGTPYQTPACVPAQQAVAALLTHGLALRLRDADPRPLLTMLNSGQETAQVIWNGGMRDELLSMLADMRNEEHPAAAADTTPGADVATSPGVQQLTAWRYSALKDELQVGGVYIRVYCANPSSVPGDVQAFCKALVRYLYEIFITGPGAPGGRTPASLLCAEDRARELRDTVAVLQALALLLDSETRLLGLLASKSAVAPFVKALQVTEDAAFAAAAPPSGVATSPTQDKTSAQDVSTSASPADESGDILAAPGGAASAGGSSDGSDTPAARLGYAVMSVLGKLALHAGCLEVLSDAATVRLLFYVAHCAPSAGCLKQALGLLRALAGQASTGMVAAEQAGAVYLLVVLLHPRDAPWPWPGGALPGGVEGQDAVQGDAALLLSRLMASPSHGTAISLQLQRLLPPALVSAITTTNPTAVLTALNGRVSTPELVWGPDMASQAAAQLVVIAHQARVSQSQPGNGPAWQLPADTALHYAQLDGELRVGGVYCRLFLKDPQYPLKEPLRFGEGLAEGLVTALHAPVTPPAATAARTLAPSELVLLLSACAVALMKHHPLVADTLATQGYVAKFTALLAARLPPAPPAAADAAAKPPPQPQAVVDEGGALLRLIHALVASTAAAEALATVGAPGAVATLSGARAWGHTAEVLVLETMKRALSESNRTRDTLVSQALQVGLVPSLLSRLDWQQQGVAEQQKGDADLAVVRALCVDVLMQLSSEGAHSAQVSALLDASPIWSAYRNQRHDLFLPSAAASEGSVAGLLTGAGAAQFALPAPERLNSDSGKAT